MVIQRWQSLLLLIAAAVMGVFSFLSLGEVQLPEYTLNLTALGFSIEGESATNATSGYYISTVPFFVISLLSAIIPLINIFFFKNLPLQKKMCLIECLFLVVVIVIAGYEGYSMISGGEVSWSTMIVAPFLALIATAMAFSRISADHRLLKSVDRLR